MIFSYELVDASWQEEVANLVGHTLLVGTTRVGKTRMMELLIGQAIMRGETVIIIDPKGDHALAENARKICAAMGCPERFVYFHPAHPEKSTPIDPMRNWNRRTELASRVAALIPSETGADPFAAFGWKVLNDIVNGLVATGESPNLVHLKRYIEGGADRRAKQGTPSTVSCSLIVGRSANHSKPAHLLLRWFFRSTSY